MEVVLSNLSIGFEIELISKVNVSFKSPSVHVIMGNNGLGKSTLFKTIAGILEPNSGTVGFFEDKFLVDCTVGLVGTERPVVDLLPVRDYLTFGNAGEISREVHEYLEQFGLQESSSKNIEELSDGQFKKIAIIRQLLRGPKILLLDEPSAYLDLDNKAFLVKLLGKLSKEMLVVISTHDVDFAKNIGDVLHVLENKTLREASLQSL